MIDGVLARAVEHGVNGVITVSTTTKNAADNLAVATRFESVWSTAGVHPLYSHDGEHDWAALGRAISHPRCVAWGELGLDNHYDHPPRAMQDRVLSEQLAYIESIGRTGVRKPVIIHCREAFDDLLPILASSALDLARVVFHCFTGTAEDARKVLDHGAWISFTGVVTYRNAGEVRRASRLVPEDRIMVETDAPFLSPDPHRGIRPCEPWMASVTARRLAEERGVSWDTFHDQINRNTSRFFGIPAV